MNILEGLQNEIDRCIEVKKLYDEIPSGGYGAFFIQKSIEDGKAALVSGDILEQIRCYKELKECG